MPKRRGRNEDPVGRHAKAARVAEAKAAKKAKAKEKEKQVAEAEAAKDKLADIEINESFAQTQENEERIRRLSDIEATTGDENNNGPEDEVTDPNVHEESDNEGSAESTSLVSDETEQTRKRASKVSFGLNSIQVQILTVTSRKTRRLCRS